MKHFPGRELASITLAVGALIGILMLKHECGQSVGNMFQALDSQPGAALSKPAPAKVTPRDGGL